MPVVTLDYRAFLSITGEEAEGFLQAVITTDLSAVGSHEAWPGALLTPQGKIHIEFLIGRIESGFLLETALADVETLAKRLTLYRLRAKASIDRLADEQVTLAWEDALPDAGLRDQRFQRAGVALSRVIGPGGTDAISLYRTARMAHGISGGGEDGALTDYFPHDLLMDRNGGLSFKKGCYIGQEVVSRMQHRATARRRLVTVASDYALPNAGAPVLAAERDVGILVASEGNHGLAVVRIDKVGAAMAGGVPILVAGQPVGLRLPAWSGLDFPVEADEPTP